MRCATRPAMPQCPRPDARIVYDGEVSSALSRNTLKAHAIALAANEFQNRSARQPLALTLLLKSMGFGTPVSSSDFSLHQAAHAENGSMSLRGTSRQSRRRTITSAIGGRRDLS